MYASQNGHVDVVEVLLKEGARADFRTKVTRTDQFQTFFDNLSSDNCILPVLINLKPENIEQESIDLRKFRIAAEEIVENVCESKNDLTSSSFF